jgi:hypothetical protein
MISASLFTIKVIAHRAINTTAIDLFCFKLSLRNVATRHTLDPLRDGSEKNGGFPRQARPTKHGLLQMIAAYETMTARRKESHRLFRARYEAGERVMWRSTLKQRSISRLAKAVLLELLLK